MVKSTMSTATNLEKFLSTIKKVDKISEENLRELIIKHQLEEIVKKYPTHPDDLNEPILQEEHRFSVLPIKYSKVWEAYKKQQSCVWKAEEVDLTNDREDYLKLKPSQQHALKLVLSFFAQSDGIVNFNLEKRFLNEIQNLEIKMTYDFQKYIENVHNESYSLMLDNIIGDEKEKMKMFNSIKTVPSIKKMTDWAIKWIESPLPFAYRVVAFSIIEGVFFSGAFALIFWFKSHIKGTQVLKGLISYNEFIARDEGMHVDFACLLYRKLLKNKIPTETIHQIFDEAVKIASEFNNDALKTQLLGLDSIKMNDYTKYVADRLLVTLGHPKKYNVKNPLKYMETIGLLNKTNFFEDRPTEYQDAKINNKKKASGKKKFMKRSDI